MDSSIYLFIYYVISVDCKWNEFSKWSDCSLNSKSCSKMRTRSIHTQAKGLGKECEGSSTETKECDQEECSG